MHRSRVVSAWDRAVTQVNGIAVWAEGIKAELAQRLPRQRKTQRDKLAVLVATMLHVRSANLVEVVAGWLSVGQAVILLADRFYATPEMICWCCDRGWDYRLRLKSNLVARLGATRTTTGALALSGGHYFENIILTGK